MLSEVCESAIQFYDYAWMYEIDFHVWWARLYTSLVIGKFGGCVVLKCMCNIDNFGGMIKCVYCNLVIVL